MNAGLHKICVDIVYFQYLHNKEKQDYLGPVEYIRDNSLNYELNSEFYELLIKDYVTFYKQDS